MVGVFEVWCAPFKLEKILSIAPFWICPDILFLIPLVVTFSFTLLELGGFIIILTELQAATDCSISL